MIDADLISMLDSVKQIPYPNPNPRPSPGVFPKALMILSIKCPLLSPFWDFSCEEEKFLVLTKVLLELILPGFVGSFAMTHDVLTDSVESCLCPTGALN